MTNNKNRTALVTGASSGLGLESAAQFAEAGYGRVIITARSQSKADAALESLRERGGVDRLETLVLDLDDHASVEAGAEELRRRGQPIDVLLLNAGIAPAKEARRTSHGIEATAAATLVGHHLLTMRLLESGLLAPGARIVIAGSEAARGDVPTFKTLDINAIARDSFGGNLEDAIAAVIRMDAPIAYHPANQYATVKLFAAWWASELSERLPEGMSAVAVSPGSTPDTNADRNAPFFMKRFLIPIFKLVPGMSHSVEDGARRYLEAAEFGNEHSGKFFASKLKKMTGPLHAIELPHFDDPGAQKALWNVMADVSGGAGYPA